MSDSLTVWWRNFFRYSSEMGEDRYRDLVARNRWLISKAVDAQCRAHALCLSCMECRQARWWTIRRSKIEQFKARGLRLGRRLDIISRDSALLSASSCRNPVPPSLPTVQTSASERRGAV